MQMGLGAEFQFTIGDTIYQEIEESLSVRFAAMERVGARSSHQRLGVGEELQTLSGVFYPEAHGGLGAYERFKAQARFGFPMIMVSGIGFVFGMWMVRNVQGTKSHFNEAGIPQRVEFTVELLKI